MVGRVASVLNASFPGESPGSPDPPPPVRGRGRAPSAPGRVASVLNASFPGAPSPHGPSTGFGRRRLLALAGVGSALAAYYLFSESLWDVSLWWEIAFLALCLMPVVFALVYLVLPVWRARGLLLVGLAFVALAAVLETGGLEGLANFAKLAAMTALGFWFLSYFETVRWVILVAAIIPIVDAYSVWRGPTRHIVTEQREIFTTLSFAFPVPGEHASANLGVPDLLFFAVFLAATVRFRLRPPLTWLLMTLSFGTTMALAVWLEAVGLPALPGLSIAFLVANADLLWRALQRGTDIPNEPVAQKGMPGMEGADREGNLEEMRVTRYPER